MSAKIEVLGQMVENKGKGSRGEVRISPDGRKQGVIAIAVQQPAASRPDVPKQGGGLCGYPLRVSKMIEPSPLFSTTPSG